MKKLKLLIILLLAQNAISQSITGTITTTPCNDDGVYDVTTTGLTLPITYTYYIGSSIIPITHTNINSFTDQLINIPMTNNGIISCQAADGNQNLWIQSTYTPSFTFSVASTSPTCPATVGSISATQTSGTSGPFTYNWVNKQTLVSYSGNNASLPLGEYSGEIIDQTSGCLLRIDTAAIISQLSNVIVSLSNTPANCTNGTATAVGSGGIAPYSYQWNNGGTTSTIIGLSQGFYSVIVTDAQGCQLPFVNQTTYVQQNPTILVNTTVTDATCIQTDGSVIAFASGGTPPYTYAWGTGQTGNTVSNIAGNTSLNVISSDANGCMGSGNAFVNSSTPISITYATTTSSCTSPTGSATLSITGGTAPYTIVWNTSPVINGLTLSNVPAGTYAFQVTDAVGCVRNGSAVINPVSTINAYTQVTDAACPNTNGLISTNVSGSNPPFTYLWSNGATTASINGLASGTYTCVITDAVGCEVTKSGSVLNDSPVNVGITTVPTSCIFAADGSVTSAVSGGLAPYTYSYTSGNNTANTSGLEVGNYYLTVTDANSCSTQKYFSITNSNTSTSCYCTIAGYIYLDANSNCTYDSGESGIENIMVHCSGYGYTFTDATGYYSFQVPTGTYTITEQVNQYYPLASCQNNSTSVSVVPATGCVSTVNIANDINTLHDLKIVTINSTLPPIPGNNYQQKVIVTNLGTVNESGVQMGYEHDGQLSFTNSTSSNFVQLNNVTAPFAYSIQSGFPTLSPNSTNVMLLNYSTPTNIPLGTNVKFYDTISDLAPISTNWLLDYSPWNNVNAYETTVIGSYDPNYKEVYPKGIGMEGNISSLTTEFDYTIHFQNEGSYFAQNVVVTDQLDPDLDWTTFRPGYSDYEYTTTISETGLVTFTFTDIQLPWKSTYGDVLSSGLVNYSIKRLASNPQGTEFTNTANIYFDYNPPITTNTTLNTLNDAVYASTEEITEDISSEIAVNIYPVPSKNNITIQIENGTSSETATIYIIDLLGNIVVSENVSLTLGSTQINQNLSHLTNGTYLARIQFENGELIVKKIVIHK